MEGNIACRYQSSISSSRQGIFSNSTPSHIRRWRSVPQALIHNWDNTHLSHLCGSSRLITIPPGTATDTSRRHFWTLLQKPECHCGCTRGTNSSSDSWATVGAHPGDHGSGRSNIRRFRVNSTEWVRHMAILHSPPHLSCRLYVRSGAECTLHHGPSKYQLLLRRREKNIPGFDC